MKYPKEVKEQAVARMMAPRNEPVTKVSRELNVRAWTLYAWRKEALRAGVVAPGDGRNSEEWSAKAKFAVVLESAALSEAELGEYCRAKGLYPEQVRSWREVCVNRTPYDGRQEARSVIQGRAVRSLATNRKLAGGG